MLLPGDNFRKGLGCSTDRSDRGWHLDHHHENRNLGCVLPPTPSECHPTERNSHLRIYSWSSPSSSLWQTGW